MRPTRVRPTTATDESRMLVSLRTDFPADHMPLLRWLMFTGVSAFGFVLAWHYGLFHLMLASDKTYISAIIGVLYVVVSLHCLVRTAVISRELDSAHRVSALVSQGVTGLRGGRRRRADRRRHAAAARAASPPTSATSSSRPSLQGAHRLDQTLLLRGLADALRGPNQLGSFASDALMKLGLLGTIIGFILMLAPIAGLDAADRASVKTSMGLMSDGMAVAMYTTLDRPDRLDPGADAVLHARRGDREAVRARHRPDRGVRRVRARARVRMDSFGNYPRERPFDPFSVMLFKALQVVAFLFFIALLAMNPEAKQGKIDTKAEFIITMTLAGQPSRRHRPLCRGSARQHRLVSRARGRLHGARPRRPRRRSTTRSSSTASKMSSPIRQETVSIRGIVAGEYTVNVNHYLATTGAPVPVVGQGREGQPDGRGRVLRHLILDHAGQEKTAVRFQRRRQRQRHRRQPSRQIADPVDAQRSPRRRNDGREAPMTATVLAISAAYVVMGVLLLAHGARRRGSPGG